MASPEEWPRLDAPPVIEVMCGMFFPPVASIDPIFVGGLQRDLGSEYEKHAIHPAVLDAPVPLFSSGFGPLRSWLISGSDEWVLQIQPDRFYVNWRRRRGEYPRFSGDSGVLKRALAEITRFRAYCSDHLKADVKPSALEVAKVDLIIEGIHWTGLEDLGRAVTLIGDLAKFAKSPSLELGLNIVDRDQAGAVRVVALSLSTETLLDGRFARAVKIETRCTAPLATPDAEGLRAAFQRLNATANAAFFGLIADGELGRFRKQS